MTQVRPGMRVFDRNGEAVGSVDLVRMGDPQAVTTEGQVGPGGDSVIDVLARGLDGGGTQVPRQLAQQMLRSGYVKIDGAGLFTKDLYATPDDIAAVVGEDVQLSVTTDRLVTAR